MNQESKFTETLQAWINTPDAQKNWDEGATLLLQLSGNKIMYRNISVNPKGKAEFIKGKLQQYLNFRLRKLTKDQVNQMQSEVDEIVEKVIKPAVKREQSQVNLKSAEREQARQSGKPAAILMNPSSVGANAISETANGKSQEFADFKAGKRADHDSLPAEVQALYVENLDIIHRMRELHLKLRTLSLDNATCPDSDRYPFLKEIIALDKRLHANWDTYDHFVIGVTQVADAPVHDAEDEQEKADEAPAEEEAPKVSDAPVEENTPEETEKAAPTEEKPKKTAGRKPKANTKKAAKK